MSEMILEPAARFRPKLDLLSSRVGDEMVLLDSEAALYFGLNGVGAFVFELICDGHSLREVHERLTATYEAEAESLWNDLVRFTDRMLELCLLSPALK